MPKAFIGLFTGDNMGKMLVQSYGRLRYFRTWLRPEDVGQLMPSLTL